MRSSYLITFFISILVILFGIITSAWLGVIILACFPLIIAIFIAEALDQSDKFHPLLRVIISGIVSLILTITVLILIAYLESKQPLIPIPASTQAEISKAFNELPEGTFIFSCPRKMTLGTPGKCKATVGNKNVISGLKQSLKKGIDENITEVKLRHISPIMNVKLTCQRFALWKDFDISPQEDGENQLVLDHDLTSWEWDVVPHESGNKKLKFMVSLILKIPGYEELQLKKYNGNEIEIFVESNLVFSINNFVKVNWKYFLTLCFVSFILFLTIRNIKIIGTNIEIGSIGNISLKNNKGVLNFLSWCQDIDNNNLKMPNTEKYIERLPDSSEEIKKSLKNLHYFIQDQDYSGLNKKQKEDAYKLLKKLTKIYINQKTDIYDCAYRETSRLKEIIKRGSNTKSGLNLVDKIFDILVKQPK